MSSPLRGSAILALLGGAAAKLGTTLGLGMPHGRNVTAARDMPAQAFGGSVMERVYTRYSGLPVGAQALEDAGWTKHNAECDQYLGYAWTQNWRGPVRVEPLVLYTTEDGLPAGVGTVIRNSMPANQVKWTTAKPLVAYADWGTSFQIDIAFRRSDVCKRGAGHSGLGDAVIVNPAGEHTMEVPVTYQQPWVRGSCFDGMGFHAFLNTNPAGPGPLPWDSADLFPVVAMYHEEQINSIFFASITSQVSIPFLIQNWWDPISLPNAVMCGNWCDNKCGFSGNGEGEWSTMHIYFNDHDAIKCPAGLTCASQGGWIFPGRRSCCPAEAWNPNVPGTDMELQRLV